MHRLMKFPVLPGCLLWALPGIVLASVTPINEPDILPLILLGLVFALCSLLVALSGRPIMFLQTRVGQNRRRRRAP